MNKEQSAADLAMKEMKKANLPVDRFAVESGGVDFFFSKPLTIAQKDKARKIARKYTTTALHLYLSKPVTL